jgi:putative Ca2+/H+ antiporter (TMEM165/GDT1 family)
MAFHFGAVLLLAYWTILVAELVGDKSLYSIASLAMRFARWQVLAGVGAAVGLKMLAAVLLGSTLAHLPGKWLALLSAVTFFATAAFFFFHPAEEPRPVPGRGASAVLVSFAAVFFAEWADPGQIAAAVLSAQHRAPLAVWLGGVAALMTKAGIGLTVGVKLRDYLSALLLRRIATVSCLVLGVAALTRFLFG